MTSCRLGLCYTEKMKCASKCSFKNSSSVNNNSHQKTHESLWFTFKTAGMCVCGCFISDCVVCLAWFWFLQNNGKGFILFCHIQENVRDKMQSHPVSKLTFQLEQAGKSSNVFLRHVNFQSWAGCEEVPQLLPHLRDAGVSLADTTPQTSLGRKCCTLSSSGLDTYVGTFQELQNDSALGSSPSPPGIS